MDLAYVAAGRFEGFWEFGLKPWDTAAGVLLVEEAGGKITISKANRIRLAAQQFLATNGQVHNEMLKNRR